MTEPVTVMVQLAGETVAEMPAKHPSKKLSTSSRRALRRPLFQVVGRPVRPVSGPMQSSCGNRVMAYARLPRDPKALSE